MQMEDTHQQEGGGDEDSCEQSWNREPLQAQIFQSTHIHTYPSESIYTSVGPLIVKS